MTSLRLDAISIAHDDGPAVVSDLSLHVASGELVALLGASGCGKTTTLRSIAGLQPLRSGEIYFDETPMSGVGPEERGVAMVFQQHLLFPFRTVLDNVSYGLRLRKVAKDERRARALSALASVHLDGVGDRLPGELSGGQRQRAALARALVVEPKVLLLDEPVSNLDHHLRSEVLRIIRSVQHEHGTTTVMVTHDQRDAAAIADRVAVMVDGAIRQVGEPSAVASAPLDDAVVRSFGDTDG